MSVMYRSLPIAVLCLPLLAEDPILEHARQVNLERAAHMTNFVADEIVTPYADVKGSGKWEQYVPAVIEDEITVNGGRISRGNFRRNGKPWRGIDEKTQRLGFTPGIPATGFAAELQPLFDPNCPTTLKFAGNDELRGKAVMAYQFDSPAKSCFGNLYGGSAYNAARTGRILIDEPSGDVLQFEEEAFGFPKGFAFVSRHQVMTWDYVKIGEASHWLPVSAEFIWTLKTPAVGLFRPTTKLDPLPRRQCVQKRSSSTGITGISSPRRISSTSETRASAPSTAVVPVAGFIRRNEDDSIGSAHGRKLTRGGMVGVSPTDRIR
jgi:hypothetical protein